VKFLFWALFIVLLIWLMRGKKHVAKGSSGTNASARPANGAEAMRQCAHCGMYVPESEAVVTAAGKVFCSEEHRLRHAS
jgi:uncharacterized protein